MKFWAVKPKQCAERRLKRYVNVRGTAEMIVVSGFVTKSDCFNIKKVI